MFCPNCGTENDDNARFCQGCGQDVSAVSPRGETPVWHAQTGYQGQQYAPSTRGVAPNVPSYLGWAIAVLILCFWPTGIAAVVNASRVGNKVAIGDYRGAEEASRRAKMWCWVSFGIAVVWVVIVIIAVAVVGVNY